MATLENFVPFMMYVYNDVNCLGRVICLDTCVDSSAQAFFNMTEYYINIAFFYHIFSGKMESNDHM